MAGAAVPNDRGFALVGDPDGGEIPRPGAGGVHGFGERRRLRSPDLLRVVLDPAGLRKVLGKFPLGRGDDTALGIEQNRA